MTNELQRRFFALRFVERSAAGDAPAKPGLVGMGLRFGHLDSYRTVFAPGCASRAVLDDFVTNGAMLVEHDWDELPVGYVTRADETADGIEVEVEYHSTPQAQAARTVALERSEANKQVGLSMAMNFAQVVPCSTGAELLDLAAKMSMPLDAFDQATIRADNSPMWLVTSLAKIGEVTQTNFPAVPKSAATSVRSGAGEAPVGQTFSDELDQALGAVQAVTQRASEVQALRAAHNKQLGKSSLDRLHELRSAIDALIQAAEAPTLYEQQQARFAEAARLLETQ